MAATITPQTRHFTTPQEFEAAYHLLFKTFATGKTKSLQWRKWQLKQLWWMIDDNEKAITEALTKDLWRHEMESLASDILGLKTDILEHIEHLEEWAADERPENAGLLFGRLGNARVRKEPLGVSLVIGAWNFPFLLTFQPVIAAIAAGCCVVIKPSELAVASEQLMVNLVEKYLDQSAIRLVTGGPEETTRILEYKFNQIFFTGSSKIARFVALAAAKHLTPTVLELGGQGPAIVTRSADLDLAAKRIAYAKFLNAGQICLSVNHVFVDPAVHDEFVRLLGKWIDRHTASASDQKTSSRGQNGHMCKIINQRNFDRLANLLGRTKGKVAYGGDYSTATLTMSLTVVTDVTVDDSLMSEELFGPICPVIKADYQTAIQTINSMPHPLAIYIFSHDSAEIRQIEDSTISGGVTINDVLMHAGVPGAPFGGVGESGMGYYHGKYGFLAFSHTRTIVAPPTWLDRLMSFRYPPFDIRHKSKLAVTNRLGFKRGEKLEDQKIKAWRPRRMAPWLTVALAVAGIAVLLDWTGGLQKKLGK